MPLVLAKCRVHRVSFVTHDEDVEVCFAEAEVESSREKPQPFM